MSFRLFRSSVTIAILALAVAFLVHMLAYSLLAQETQAQAWNALQGDREMGELITRLEVADPRDVIVRELAGTSEARLAEYRAWSGLDAAAFEAVQASARRVAEAAAYLNALPLEARSALLEGRTARQQFDALTNPEAFDRFIQRAEGLGVPLPLGDDAEALRSLLTEERPQLLEAASRIQAGHHAAIEHVRGAYPGTSALAMAADPPADLVETLHEAGYTFKPEQRERLEAVAEEAQDLDELGQEVLRPQVRAAVARRVGLELGDVGLDSTLRSISGSDDAAWLAEQLSLVGASDRFTPERLETLASAYRAEQGLQAVAGDSPPVEAGGLFGLDERTQWLIALSFMVCVVGVANAMLMSVTERFTEIATMKCLGAMDRFVMMMFVFEAIFQGIVGGLAGLVLGVLLAVLRAGAEFGSLLTSAAPAVGQVALAAVLSLVIGVLLAAVAAVGPSWVAARLAPMEAMRVE